MTLFPSPLKLWTLLLAVWITLLPALEASVSSRLSSRFLARGERAILEVAIVGKRPTTFPEIPPIEGVKIQPTGRGPQTQMIPGRRVEHVYSYIISSYEVGQHEVRPIRVQLGADIHLTEPLNFSVFNPDDLTWGKAMAGDTEFRYASTFKVLDENPYVDQAVPVEIKLYVPRDLFVIDWGIPDFERDGVTAWRMQPRETRSEINLLGMPYISIAYPSTLTPNRVGETSIGPAKVRLTSTQVVMDGILRRMRVESWPEIPQLKIAVKELPANAPSGFENAVGQFKIQTRIDKSEVREGDPIPVDILVSGSGNLDTLRPPIPTSPLGWKVYEPSRQQRGDERRELSGSVSFQQFLRPLELKSGIPPYKLTFFNPKTGTYESVQTEAIALQMTPAPSGTMKPVGPAPQLDTPIEEMTDILGLIPNANLIRKPPLRINSWWLHGLGTFLLLALVIRILWLHGRHRLQVDPIRRQQLSELKELEKQTADDQYLMAAGRFIERWLGKHSDPEIRGILQERDSSCFQGDTGQAVKIESSRRKAILATLRRGLSSCLLIASCLFIGSGSLRAEDTAEDANTMAREAYESARYDQAIEHWLGAAPYAELSADTLYHIGNACYRAGSSGHAALYYRRALARDGQHQEARQNLRFIERQYGVLTIQRPDHQYLLAHIPLEAWKSVTWGGLWLCVLGLLCFPATKRGAKVRNVAITAIIVSPLFSVGGGLAWSYYPDDAVFAPLESQAVVVNPKSQLHTEASRNSSVVIETPAGSLCEVLYESGEWSYISFATQTRGWLPSKNIKLVEPKETPKPPKISKPVADETSA